MVIAVRSSNQKVHMDRDQLRALQAPHAEGASRMNVQLSSDVAGESGLHIIEAILPGERDPEQLRDFQAFFQEIESPVKP
jgi:hypothetical protein